MGTKIAPFSMMCASTLALACSADGNGDRFATGDAGETQGTAGTTSSGEGSETGNGTQTGGTGEPPDGTDQDPDGVRFDVAGGEDGSGGEGGPMQGCEKVDFLFVIDKSLSMAQEQTNLANSFPGFVQTLQTTIAAKDYQVMVVDTDWTAYHGKDMQCNGSQPCCAASCADHPTASCDGVACGGTPTCDQTLGAGNVFRNGDPLDQACELETGRRFITDGHTDLPGVFDCMAHVGTEGDWDEQQAAAATRAVSGELVGASGCNEGFLRDDAILVVTLISDEEDSTSAGNPGDWYQALVDAKSGNPDHVVMLGLVGEHGPDSLCATPLMGGGTAWSASNAVRLQQFVERFAGRGMWASVCEPDYSPFFEEAVALIDLACDEFVPPG